MQDVSKDVSNRIPAASQRLCWQWKQSLRKAANIKILKAYISIAPPSKVRNVPFTVITSQWTVLIKSTLSTYTVHIFCYVTLGAIMSYNFSISVPFFASWNFFIVIACSQIHFGKIWSQLISVEATNPSCVCGQLTLSCCDAYMEV